MMGKKKMSETRAEVAALLEDLPEGWLEKKVKAAAQDSSLNAKTLEMLCSALEQEAAKRQKAKKKRAAV